MRDVTVHQKWDGWTAVKTRKKKSDHKPPRQECHSLSTMLFQSNDCNLQSHAHLVYITPSLLKRKNLALQSKNPAQRRWSSLLVNQWRLDFHDQGQNLQMRAISQKVPTDQNTRNLIREDESMFARWRPPLDWAALVESCSWTWSLLAPGGGAVSTWLLRLRWVPW